MIDYIQLSSGSSGLKAQYAQLPITGKSRVDNAIRLAFCSSWIPLLFKSSGIIDAAQSVMIERSKVDTEAIAVVEINSCSPCNELLKSFIKLDAAPVVMMDERDNANTAQLKSLFSRKLEVNHPISDLYIPDVMAFLVDM